MPCEQRPELFIQTRKAFRRASLSNKAPLPSPRFWSHLVCYWKETWLRGREGSPPHRETTQPVHPHRKTVGGQEAAETTRTDVVNSLSRSASSELCSLRCCRPSTCEPEARTHPAHPSGSLAALLPRGGPRHARVPDLQPKDGKHIPWWWPKAGWSLCPPKVWSPRAPARAGPRFGAWCLLARPCSGGAAASVPERHGPLHSRGSVLAGPRPGSFIPAPVWRHWLPLLPAPSHQGELQLWKKETCQIRGSLQTHRLGRSLPDFLGLRLEEASGYNSHPSLKVTPVLLFIFCLESHRELHWKLKAVKPQPLYFKLKEDQHHQCNWLLSNFEFFDGGLLVCDPG